MSFETVGFHGTDFSNVASIKENGFLESASETEWLGRGVYFFVEGIGCPKTNATQWAKNQSYDKQTRCNSYEKYGVIKVSIKYQRFLDTTIAEGLNAFNMLREKIIAKHQNHFVPNRTKFSDDNFMWNMVALIMDLDAVKHNLYIKNCVQRRRKIASNVPNTTVLCVKKNERTYLSIEEIQCGGVA